MESSSGTSPSLYSESSKTGSSKSASCVEKDRDPKDNTTSPIDLECKIQTERITKILDDTIYRIKLAICIPILMEENTTLSSILTEEHMADCLFVYNQFDSPLYSSSYLNVVAKEDIEAGDLSLKNRLNPELSHIIYIISNYPVLKPKIEEIVEKLKEEFLTKMNSYGDASKSVVSSSSPLEFLTTFEKFRELMIVQMETTAAEELATKINTRKLKKSNERLKEKIEEHRRDLKEENEDFNAKMKEKQETIAKLEEELSVLKQGAMIKLKKKILDSERQMVLASRAHAVKADMMKEEEAETSQAYEQQLVTHLEDEKNMRARRFKVETQLASWIQKYDLEMGDKQVELDEFTEKYEDELKQCEDLEVKLAEQDKEYIPLMAEREEEYHQEMAEKMNKFLLEHAARVIQHAWREVLANRAEKKRLKKLQKKLKAAAVVAAKKK